MTQKASPYRNAIEGYKQAVLEHLRKKRGTEEALELFTRYYDPVKEAWGHEPNADVFADEILQLDEWAALAEEDDPTAIPIDINGTCYPVVETHTLKRKNNVGIFIENRQDADGLVVRKYNVPIKYSSRPRYQDIIKLMQSARIVGQNEEAQPDFNVRYSGADARYYSQRVLQDQPRQGIIAKKHSQRHK